MAKVPRFYQQEAVDAFFNSINEPGTHPLIGIPTGGGKSMVIAMICRRVLQIAPSARIIISCMSQELVEQDVAAILEHWPYAPVGVFCDGLASKESRLSITVGTLQSMVKSAKLFGRQTFLIIDEAQNVSPTDETLYQKFIAVLRETNPKLVVGGLSATLYRSKGGYLVDHGLFNNVCYDITSARAFEVLCNEGYLVPLRSRPTKFYYDTSAFKTIGGDFNQKQVQEAVNVREKNERALAEALGIGRELHHWIVFCAGIDHIMAVHEILTEWGENAVCVHSKMGQTERKHALTQFKSGAARMIVSDNVLTTGFDAPFVDHIVFMRPTKSVVKHVQGSGRGTRPYYMPGYDLTTKEGRLGAIEASGKLFCRVSDFGRNFERLGPINDPIVPGAKKSKGDMPIKICTTDKLKYGRPRGNALGCECYNFCAARRCEECGEEFIFEDGPKIMARASDAPATRLSAPVAVWVPVDHVLYETFSRPFTAPAMRVIYKSGLNRYSELISIEHKTAYVRHIANEWWRARGMEPPEFTLVGMRFVDQAPKPSWILCQLNLTHPKIIQISFETQKPELEFKHGTAE